MGEKDIEKIKLDRGWDVHKGKTPYQDVASGVGLMKIMDKINEIIERINENNN